MIPVLAEAVRNTRSAVADKIVETGENMRFFIDTAKVEEIKKANDMGVICGVTVDLSRIAGEGRVFSEAIAEMMSIIDGPVCCAVSADIVDAEDMIAEGRAIAAIHPNMVVKVPMTAAGMAACKVLVAEGVRINVATMFSANQALQAARAGAAYVSPFTGRLNDVNQRGVDLIREVADLFSVCEVDTQIIATNIHDPARIADCELAGADIAAIPYDVLEQITRKPQPDTGNAGVAVEHKM